MRSQILLSAILILYLATACNSSKQLPSNEVVGTIFIESPGEGLVTLRATGYGSNFRKAETDAIIRAYQVLLFDGVPRFTAMSRPLVTSEIEFNRKAPNFFEKFMSEGTYERFLTEQWDATEVVDSRRDRRVAKEMTINYRLLRQYLEQNGLTRKFGY